VCVAQVFREPAISIILADATHERTLDFNWACVCAPAGLTPGQRA
jgi:hypothetical protein